MCPTFRPSPREEASPRSKANLARGILTGTLPAGTVADDAFKEVCDLCVHCHMCRLECPANVDIPKLMAEAKGAYVATGTTVTQDVPDDALAIGRARQDNKLGYAPRLKARLAAQKKG